MVHKDKIIPSTERDILREISKELRIPQSDVDKTYNIWLDYLKHIVEETPQSTISFPNLGKMYVSYHRMSRIKNVKDRRIRKIKKEHIEKTVIDCKYNVHKQTPPISIWYGVGRKNIPIGKNKDGFYDNFTKEELIRLQNERFFKEDFDFSENEKLKEKYLKGYEPQKPI